MASKGESDRRWVANELIILAGKMDFVADEISALGGELAIQHAGALRGAAQMAREWAKEIREGK